MDTGAFWADLQRDMEDPEFARAYIDARIAIGLAQVAEGKIVRRDDFLEEFDDT